VMAEHKAVWLNGQPILVCDGHFANNIQEPMESHIEDFTMSCDRCGGDVRISLRVENIL